jgi:hypothetical protein
LFVTAAISSFPEVAVEKMGQNEAKNIGGISLLERWTA